MTVSQRLYRRATQVLIGGVLAWLLGLATSRAEKTLTGPWHICAPFEKRITCIVDGDTFWFQGEKMRLESVNTPEVDGPCAVEQALAREARSMLLKLMSSEATSIFRVGVDRYGRTLVQVRTADSSIGRRLLEHGLAETFGQRPRRDWCQ